MSFKLTSLLMLSLITMFPECS